MKKVKELMTVIIKDGNRIVNWELPHDMTLGELIDRWEKDYYPADEFTVWDKEGKMVIEVKTKFPKKQKKEEAVDVG